ncbi:MAG: DUF4406 domain-containing protein [Thomasclavelia sp.]
MERKLKVYIAGAITNNPYYEEQFNNCEQLLIFMGHVPLNPVKNIGFDYKAYIDMGLCELMQCDAICFINNEISSKGVNLERLYAKTVGMPMFRYDPFLDLVEKIYL